MLKSKILIVDDTRAGRETLEELLFSPLYDLFFACNGKEALEESGRVSPDLILLDVMMPDMNGFEVCRKLRQNSRLAEVPVIMITALDDSESRLEGIEAGADDFISKPFDGAELRARVRTITRLNRYRRLHQERAKFEWVIERSGDGYLTATEKGTINYANPAARLYLGLKEDPARGGYGVFAECVRAHHVLQPEQAWSDVLSGKTVVPDVPLFLIRPASATSDVLWLEVTPFDNSTMAPGERLFRLQNISNQMTSQREMWTFHSRISYKLRTPLNSILASAKALTGGLAGMPPEEVERLAQVAQLSAEKLNSELTDILQYLRIPTLSRFGERIAVKDLEGIVGALAGDMGIQAALLPVPPEIVSRRLTISERGMGWVLRELFENSVKFHPIHRPKVTVEISCTVPDWATIRVIDDGRALGPNQLAKALVPYYQGDRFLSGMMEGMGLGLSLVSSVIWEAKGSCRIRNREEGAGVIFEMTIPTLE